MNEFNPLQENRTLTALDKAKIISNDFFQTTLYDKRMENLLKEHKETAKEWKIDKPIFENWMTALDDEKEQKVTIEDEEEMWKKIEKDYLVEQKENSIIKSTTLEKYINKLKQKELVYKECVNCDSGMVLISESIQILKELEAELTLKTNI